MFSRIHILNIDKKCGKCQCGNCEVTTDNVSFCNIGSAKQKKKKNTEHVFHLLAKDLRDGLRLSKTYSSTRIQHLWQENDSDWYGGDWVGRGRRSYCHGCLKKMFPKHSPRKVVKVLKIWDKNPVAGLTMKKFVEAALPRK